MDPSARHLLIDVWLEEPLTEGLVDGLLGRARAELSVVNEVRHRFEPQGLTALFVLKESHFALHTYPEEGYFSLDVYVCNPAVDVDGITDRLLAPLRIHHQERQSLWRGVKGGARRALPRAAGLTTRE
jgi:S-adenosylmethionine/arginine decarboxylase-like enzyme